MSKRQVVQNFWIGTVLLSLAACGGATNHVTQTAPVPQADPAGTPKPIERPIDPTVDLAPAEAQVREYVAAKTAHEFGRMWDMAAQVHKDIVIAVGKRMAERDDSTAKAQGFESAAQVQKLNPRAYFVRHRVYLATQQKNVYKKGAVISRLEMKAPIMVPFPGHRVAVHPVRVHLSDGTVDRLGVTREGDHWRLLEK